MHGRRALLGIVLLLLGSTAAGLVVLAPAVPVEVGAVSGLVLVAAGLWLLVTDVRDRLLGLRVAAEAAADVDDLAARLGLAP